LKEMNLKLLEKIEELTVYTIKQKEQQDKIKDQESRIKSQENRLRKIETMLNKK